MTLILISLGNLINVLAPRGPFDGSLKFIFVVILLSCAVALIIADQNSSHPGPKEDRSAGSPRVISDVIARLADVPEPGAMIIVYGGLIAAVIVSTVAFIVTLVSFLS